MPKRPATIFISAAEDSGDEHASNLIRAIRRRREDIRLVGVGGEKMAAAGCELVADLTSKSDDEEIAAADLEPCRDLLEPGDILLLATGWPRFRGKDRDRWMHHSPYLTQEGAEWICARGLKGVGIDHFTIGTTLEQFDRPPHETLLRRRVWIAEDLVIPEELFERRKWLYVGVPLRIEGASGAPVRPVVLDIAEENAQG